MTILKIVIINFNCKRITCLIKEIANMNEVKLLEFVLIIIVNHRSYLYFNTNLIYL